MPLKIAGKRTLLDAAKYMYTTTNKILAASQGFSSGRVTPHGIRLFVRSCFDL